MTDTDARIHRLATILAQECPNLDLRQIRPLLEDLRDSSYNEERSRVLSLLRSTYRFLMQNRGKGFRKELEDCIRLVEIGTQLVFDDE